MEDRDFFDLLYQQWSKTTGAENTYWMPQENQNFPGEWVIFSVDAEENYTPVAMKLTEADADFITAVHGCFGDLVKRLHTALDESDRLDEEKDGLVVRIAELELEVEKANADVEYWRSR